ncbi:hypothetical protein [Peptacetobacter sp.]|uniref:hypothetical protein n=1 Tax=Peptacetobacter sp. TaxID=2991975 RepID=UPI0026044B7A|nr:hypothetical protein [Peptacetobacter sp.]
MKRNKFQIKILLLIILLILTKIFIINPIEKKKELLETEKYQISEDMKKVEQYKKETEILKDSNKNSKKCNKKDDLIYIQNMIGEFVDLKSIENSFLVNDKGDEESIISLDFIGTYKDIFKVIDRFKEEKISNEIKSIKISKVDNNTDNNKIETKKDKKGNIIEDIKEIKKEKEEENKKNNTVKFECILEISR